MIRHLITDKNAPKKKCDACQTPIGSSTSKRGAEFLMIPIRRGNGDIVEICYLHASCAHKALETSATAEPLPFPNVVSVEDRRRHIRTRILETGKAFPSLY